MRAIVTGGAGFIGSNLSDRIASEEGKVTVCDSLQRGASKPGKNEIVS